MKDFLADEAVEVNNREKRMLNPSRKACVETIINKMGADREAQTAL